MAQNFPPYPQGPPNARGRGPSNASMDRYIPENYPSPQPSGGTPGYARPAQARGPSFGQQQIPSSSPMPMPQPNSYFPPQGMAPPQNQPQLSSSYPKTPPYLPPQQQPYQQPHVDQDGYMLPPEAPRRLSASSAHSRRSSHHSRSSRSHSHGSHGSHSSRDHHGRNRSRSAHSHHRDRHSYDHDGRSYQREREKPHHHHHRRHHSDDEYKPAKRTDSHRPSWGDSVYAMFGVLKDYLTPYEKR